MISLKKVSYRYSGSKTDTISDFSLSFERGRIVGLLGANGSGKSTLLYLISGLLKPANGEIEVNGHNPWLREAGFLNQIFLVPEEPEIPAVGFRDYADAYAPYYPNFSVDTLANALQHFNLSEDIHLGSLSMGQKKKAFLAFALACHTPILLMDEPTNGLDIPGKSEFRRAVASTMDEERTIIISTHQVRDLEQLLDHVAIMDNNGIIINRSIAEIQDKLQFTFVPVLPDSGVLWSEPVMAGYSIIKSRNPEEPETDVNLETLFNYTYSRKQ